MCSIMVLPRYDLLKIDWVHKMDFVFLPSIAFIIAFANWGYII